MQIQNTYNLIGDNGTTLVSGSSLQTIYDYITANPTVSGTVQQVQQITSTVAYVANGTIH